MKTILKKYLHIFFEYTQAHKENTIVMSYQTEELRKYFAVNGIKNAQICEATGIHPSSLSNLLSGKRGLPKKYAIKFAEVYGFNLQFLLNGEGELLPKSPAFKSTADGSSFGKERAEEVVEVSRGLLDAVWAENARLRKIVEELTKPCKG